MEGDLFQNQKPGFIYRVRQILPLFGPSILSNVFKKFQSTISLLMVGRIALTDSSVMAGVALGHMNKVILGSTILVGVNGCIETYIS